MEAAPGLAVTKAYRYCLPEQQARLSLPPYHQLYRRVEQNKAYNRAGKTAEISSAQQALEIHEECLVTLKEKGIVTFEASPEEKAMLWAESRPRFIKEMERDMGKSATKMYIQLAEASKKGTRTWKETCTARPLH